MATIRHMAIAVAVVGVKAFTFGILAEHEKPDSGKPVISNGVVTCKYPSDPSIIFGFLSMAFPAASAVVGFFSIFHPYKGIEVPLKVLFHRTTMVVFFQIAIWVTLLAEGMLLWTTVTELMHLTNNVHHNINTTCPTAKTGLFGGAAFICLMLTDNARDDYFEEENHKGFTTDNNTKEQSKI